MKPIFTNRFTLLKVVEWLSESYSEPELSLIVAQYQIAIQVVGIDHLDKVWNNLVIWLLLDQEIGVIRYCRDLSQRVTIEHIFNQYERLNSGELIELNYCQKLQENLRIMLDEQAFVARLINNGNYSVYKAILASTLAANFLVEYFKVDEEDFQKKVERIQVSFVKTIIDLAFGLGGEKKAKQTAIAIKNKLFSLLWDLQILRQDIP